MNIIIDSGSDQGILLPGAHACPDCLPLSSSRESLWPRAGPRLLKHSILIQSANRTNSQWSGQRAESSQPLTQSHGNLPRRTVATALSPATAHRLSWQTKCWNPGHISPLSSQVLNISRGWYSGKSLRNFAEFWQTSDLKLDWKEFNFCLSNLKFYLKS